MEKLSKAQIQQLFRDGSRLSCFCFKVVYASGTGKVAFATQKSIGSHVTRNRTKRRIKEAFRLSSYGNIQQNINVVFLANKECLGVEFTQLVELLRSCFSKLAQ